MSRDQHGPTRPISNKFWPQWREPGQGGNARSWEKALFVKKPVPREHTKGFTPRQMERKHGDRRGLRG